MALLTSTCTALKDFLPEAFRNFLALLGWSPGGDEEFLRTSQLLEKFTLEGVSRTNGVFGRDKLEWFNTQYLQKLPIDELLPQVEAQLKTSKLWKDEWASGSGREWFSKTVDLLRPRVRLLPDLPPGRVLFSPMTLCAIPQPRKILERSSSNQTFAEQYR